MKDIFTMFVELSHRQPIEINMGIIQSLLLYVQR